jgi:hypothetical protein
MSAIGYENYFENRGKWRRMASLVQSRRLLMQFARVVPEFNHVVPEYIIEREDSGTKKCLLFHSQFFSTRFYLIL